MALGKATDFSYYPGNEQLRLKIRSVFTNAAFALMKSRLRTSSIESYLLHAYLLGSVQFTCFNHYNKSAPDTQH
jgi:hypothetical protein